MPTVDMPPVPSPAASATPPPVPSPARRRRGLERRPEVHTVGAAALLALALSFFPSTTLSAAPSPSSLRAAALERLSDAAGLGLSDGQRTVLAAGDPVVVPTPVDGEGAPAAAGIAYRVLPAAAERLARAAADWPHYPEFFPFVLSSEVTAAEDGGGRRVRQRVDLPFPFPDRRLTLRTGWRAAPGAAASDGRPDYEVTWSHVPGTGNVEHQVGSWRLWELPGAAAGESAEPATLVALSIASDAGSGVPDGLEEKALLETLEWALDGVRQQVNRCRYDRPRHPTCGEEPPLDPDTTDSDITKPDTNAPYTNAPEEVAR